MVRVHEPFGQINTLSLFIINIFCSKEMCVFPSHCSAVLRCVCQYISDETVTWLFAVCEVWVTVFSTRALPYTHFSFNNLNQCWNCHDFRKTDAGFMLRNFGDYYNYIQYVIYFLIKKLPSFVFTVKWDTWPNHMNPDEIFKHADLHLGFYSFTGSYVGIIGITVKILPPYQWACSQTVQYVDNHVS